MLSYSAANPHDSTMKMKPLLYVSIKDPDDEVLLSRELVILGARTKDHKIDKIKVRGAQPVLHGGELREASDCVVFDRLCGAGARR